MMLNSGTPTSLTIGYTHGQPPDTIHGKSHVEFFFPMAHCYRFANIEAVIAGLSENFPDPVRREMLRHLAMYQVERERIEGLLLDGEDYQYERFLGAQQILLWAGLPRSKRPELMRKLGLRGVAIRWVAMQYLPPGIGEFFNLEALSLGDNNIVRIPAEIGELRKLQVLELWGNQITTLPPEILHLSNLRVLYLVANPLEASNNALINKLRTRGVQVYL
jgi:Leucine-rich repeat (LRR) protein